MALYVPAGTRIELELEDGATVILPYGRLIELLKSTTGRAGKGMHSRALKAYVAALRSGYWMGGTNEISPERVRLKASDYYEQAMRRGEKFTEEELKLYAQIMGN